MKKLIYFCYSFLCLTLILFHVYVFAFFESFQRQGFYVSVPVHIFGYMITGDNMTNVVLSVIAAFFFMASMIDSWLKSKYKYKVSIALCLYLLTSILALLLFVVVKFSLMQSPVAFQIEKSYEKPYLIELNLNDYLARAHSRPNVIRVENLEELIKKNHMKGLRSQISNIENYSTLSIEQYLFGEKELFFDLSNLTGAEAIRYKLISYVFVLIYFLNWFIFFYPNGKSQGADYVCSRRRHL